MAYRRMSRRGSRRSLARTARKRTATTKMRPSSGDSNKRGTVGRRLNRRGKLTSRCK